MNKIFKIFFSRKKKSKNMIIYNLKIFILAIAIIMIWRGIWNFLDHYIMPNDFIFSNTLTILIGIIILFFNDSSLEFLVDPEEEE